MKQLYHNSEKCKPYKRCKNFKNCKTCSKIRQAQLADTAELASRFSKYSQYAVVMPFDKAQNHIKELKTKLTRKLKTSTNGIMTTVESSANDALHLNFIINSDIKLSTKPFSKIIENMNFEASIFIDELTTTTDIRRATAYSNKIESIPTPEQYQGNIMNSTGDVRTCREIMQSQRMIERMPIIALVSINQTLTQLGLEPIDNYIFESDFIQKNIRQIMNYGEQLKKMGKCYSPRYGLMTEQDFKSKFNRKIGTLKAKATRDKNAHNNPRNFKHFGLRPID